MKFFKGTFLSILVSVLIIILNDIIMIPPNSVGYGAIIAFVYVPPVTFIGCILGEFIYRVLERFQLIGKVISYFIYLSVGFIVGLEVIKYFFGTIEYSYYALLTAISSLVFYIGRKS